MHSTISQFKRKKFSLIQDNTVIFQLPGTWEDVVCAAFNVPVPPEASMIKSAVFSGAKVAQHHDLSSNILAVYPAPNSKLDYLRNGNGGFPSSSHCNENVNRAERIMSRPSPF